MFSLWAAKSFSFRPPIGKIIPLRVISPVIATLLETFLFKIRDMNEVTIAIPADGPSFGIEPSGK